jgi:hypothetical protein
LAPAVAFNRALSIGVGEVFSGIGLSTLLILLIFA